MTFLGLTRKEVRWVGDEVELTADVTYSVFARPVTITRTFRRGACLAGEDFGPWREAGDSGLLIQECDYYSVELEKRLDDFWHVETWREAARRAALEKTSRDEIRRRSEERRRRIRGED
jgi:hypothetical protein